MKRLALCGVVCILLFGGVVSAGIYTDIYYSVTDLGGDRWQYTYDVYNLNLPLPGDEIEEFTIWFGIGDYDNLAIETLDPPSSSWDEVTWDPEPFLGDDGGYDALATGLNIAIGENVSGFAVSFDWLGTGDPGSQFYEIIDKVAFDTIDSGYTVPEPATMLLFGIGGLILLKKRSV